MIVLGYTSGHKEASKSRHWLHSWGLLSPWANRLGARSPNHRSLPPPPASAPCAVPFTLLKGTLLILLCAYLCPLPFAVQLWQPFTPLVLSCSGFLVLSDKRQDSFSPLPLKQDCPSLSPNSFCLHLFLLEPAGKIRQNCSDKVYSYLDPFLRGQVQA